MLRAPWRERIHRLTAHTPDPGRHCQRFYGAYSNRARAAPSSTVGAGACVAADAQSEKDNSDFSREAQNTWARLPKKIFAADPLLCTCGARMAAKSRVAEVKLVTNSELPGALPPRNQLPPGILPAALNSRAISSFALPLSPLCPRIEMLI